MTNNNLTDGRLDWLHDAATELAATNLKMTMNPAEVLQVTAELQQRRVADKNFFMYGIAEPDGSAYMDEVCVSHDIGVLEVIIDELRAGTGDDGYRIVALHAALPLTDSEREELQQYRKAAGEPIRIEQC